MKIGQISFDMLMSLYICGFYTNKPKQDLNNIDIELVQFKWAPTVSISHKVTGNANNLACHCSSRTYPFTFMHFPVKALPVVENQFLKNFSNKVLYIYCSKFF